MPDSYTNLLYHRFLLLLALLFAGAAVASAQSPQLVDVGGFRLDVLRKGSGGPPVILVGGLGNALDTWAQITQAAAQFTTMVALRASGMATVSP